MRDIILGAGVTGLAASYKTDAPIYEASNKPGGICRSYYIDGYQFEVGGGHWIFGDNQIINWIKNLVDINSYERKAGIYYNKMFPYPIQTFTEKKNESTPGYFKNWLGKKFCNEICNMFFYPFNEKYTAGMYDDIIQFDSYKTPPAGSVGFVSRFHDPVDGLSALIDKMAENAEINYGKKAIMINVAQKEVHFEDGDSVKYDRLISTIPLDKCLELCGQNKFELPYSSVLVLNIGADPGPNLPEEHWIYVPFCKTGFYRVGFYTNVEANKAPEGKVSVCVEFAAKGEYADLDIEQITKDTISELQSWGWISRVNVTDPTWVKHAYTWNRTKKERERHIRWLAKKDITTVGRYGLWKFQGMVESIEQGLSL